MSIEPVMSSNHFILCCPLFLIPQSFPASGSFHDFSHNSGGLKSKTKVSAGLLSSETSLFVVDGLLLHVSSHGPFSVYVSVLFSSSKDTFQIGLGPTHMTSLLSFRLLATPCTAACQATLSFTISRTLLRFMSMSQ